MQESTMHHIMERAHVGIPPYTLLGAQLKDIALLSRALFDNIAWSLRARVWDNALVLRASFENIA